MIELKNFTPRKYQEEIFETSKEKNTLAVLPTGTGKTIVALLLAVYRLNKIQDTKAIIVSPTKPLANQHKKTFEEHTTLDPEKIELITGTISPEKRMDLYKHAKVIVATPQTIKEDITNNRFSFKDCSSLIIDEAHHSIGNYAYTFVAKRYAQEAEFPRILALTASPGGTKEKITEICDNLSIEAVEIRTEEDMREHVQEKKTEWIYVELPKEFKELHNIIKNVYKEKIEDLKKIGVTKPVQVIGKKDLIQIQTSLRKEIHKNNPSAYYWISLTALLIKLDYALELLETQSINSLQQFWEKLKKEETKASKTIVKNPEIEKAMKLTAILLEKEIKHPKLEKLYEIIKEEISQDPKARIIVFANFRNTINEIVDYLTKKGISAHKFVGQADRQDKGLKQREQIEVLNKFKEGEFNILVSSQVAEEGIDIVETRAVIFFESIASELRKVQRSGRTARTKPGKIIFLLTKGTRDEAYYWSAHRKEKRIKQKRDRSRDKTID